MSGKRKRYSADYKAKVALKALRGELMVSQLVAKHGVHQTPISAWKRQALKGCPGCFRAFGGELDGSGRGARETAREGRASRSPALRAGMGSGRLYVWRYQFLTTRPGPAVGFARVDERTAPSGRPGRTIVRPDRDRLARKAGDRDIWLQALRHDRLLLFHRPAPPMLAARDHLDAPRASHARTHMGALIRVLTCLRAVDVRHHDGVTQQNSAGYGNVVAAATLTVCLTVTAAVMAQS